MYLSYTGKRLIARAVANKNKAYFLEIHSSEIISQSYVSAPASRSILREVFKKAEEESPTVIYISGLDEIFPKHVPFASQSGTISFPQFIFAELKVLMNEIKPKSIVIFMGGACSHRIHEYLLDRDLFTDVVHMSNPNDSDRLEILRIHTRDISCDEADLKAIAKETKGYAAADLATVCQRAALINFDKGETNVKILHSRKITSNDFKSVLNNLSSPASSSGSTGLVSTAKNTSQGVPSLDSQNKSSMDKCITCYKECGNVFKCCIVMCKKIFRP